VVWRANLMRWAASVERLRSGETLVGESLGYELLDAAGRSKWFRKSESRVTCIQELSGGEIFYASPTRTASSSSTMRAVLFGSSRISTIRGGPSSRISVWR